MLTCLLLGLNAPPPGSLDNLLQASMVKRGIPGGVIAMSTWARQPRTKGSYGVLSLSSQTPTQDDSPFIIASITNASLGTLSAMLVCDGKISWETKFQDLFPELAQAPDYLKRASLYEVACCASGLPGGADYDVIRKMTAKYPKDPRAARAAFVTESVFKMSPEAIPVTKDTHGQPGYYVNAMMLERAANMSYEQIVAEYYVKRLGMKSAVVGPPVAPDGKPFGLVSHALSNGALKENNFPYNSLVMISMSAEDLVKLGEENLRAMLGQSKSIFGQAAKILFQKSAQGIRTPAWTTSNGKASLQTTGNIGGSTSFMAIDAVSGKIVAGAANIDYAEGGYAALREVADVLLKN